MATMIDILNFVKVSDEARVRFLEEEITPEVVTLMSRNDWDKVGIDCNSRTAMRIRQLSANRRVPTLDSGNGKPKYCIQKEEIEELQRLGLTKREIAFRVGFSVKTLDRRMTEFGLDSYTATSQAELDAVVTEVMSEHPTTGESMLRGHLSSRNIRVPRTRLRESINDVNPMGVTGRTLRRLKRRSYYVKGPNELWHIDGNHKLIRWKIVIHAAVDGYSRFPTFVQASNNNKAMTVLESFLGAVQRHGVPVRVRADAGGEHVMVQRFMEVLRGSDIGCFLIGRSTHNQRIERLWRDIFSGVLCQFYQQFYDMEDQNILDPDNILHLTALHSVFLPIINRKLLEWQEAWAFHKIRTVGRCPYEMFTFGFHAIQEDLLCTIDEALLQLPDENISQSASTMSASVLTDGQTQEIRRLCALSDNNIDQYHAVLEVL